MSTIGFIEQDNFENLLISIIGTGTFSTSEQTLIGQCLTESHNLILNELIGRGLTVSQINGWLRKEEFQQNIAIYLFALYTGKIGDEPSKSKYNPYDLREALKDVTIVTSTTTDNVTTYSTIDSGSIGMILDLAHINKDLLESN
jgi:hypothetical protein